MLIATSKSAFCLAWFFCPPISPKTFSFMSLRLIGQSYLSVAFFIHSWINSGSSYCGAWSAGVFVVSESIIGMPKPPASSVISNCQSSTSLPRASCCLTVKVTFPSLSFFLIDTRCLSPKTEG